MTNKKIVIFGTDNSGKTTLANNIMEKFPGFRVIKSLGPATLEQQISYMDKNLSSEENLIFDRFPIIEEFTCGKVLRNKNNFEGMDIKLFLDKVDLFIYCNPGLNNIQNWGSREQMDGIKFNIVKLYEAYWEMPLKILYDTNNNIMDRLIIYDWSRDNDEVLMQRIKIKLEEN